jgi:hypothetical protein
MHFLRRVDASNEGERPRSTLVVAPSVRPHAGTLEHRPHIGAATAASLAGELGLQV